MIIFPELEISKDGKILNCNTAAEQVLNELSIMRVFDRGKFIVDKLQSSSTIFKTFSTTYGMKYEVKEDAYNVVMISIEDMGMSVDSFLDINSLQHEIKNPLTIINGTSQLLNNKYKDKYIKKCTTIMINETNRIKQLLENISIISDIQLEPSIFSITDFVKELTDSLSIVFQDIQFTVEMDPHLDTIEGDRHKLFMAVNNILKNACEAQGSGVIAISVKVDPFIKYFDRSKNQLSSMIKFSINDKAGGIEDEMLSKIFTPFFTTKNKGSGLGLVIAKELIEKHQGRIELISEKNIGTTFNILLPL